MSKKKKSSKENKETPKVVKENTPIQNDEKPFDFGGLPSINLKKNLGCG